MLCFFFFRSSGKKQKKTRSNVSVVIYTCSDQRVPAVLKLQLHTKTNCENYTRVVHSIPYFVRPEASVIATTSSVLPYKRRYLHTRRRAQTPRHRPAQPIQAYIGRPPPPPPSSKRSAVAASGATTDHY